MRIWSPDFDDRTADEMRDNDKKPDHTQQKPDMMKERGVQEYIVDRTFQTVVREDGLSHIRRRHCILQLKTERIRWRTSRGILYPSVWDGKIQLTVTHMEIIIRF